MREYTVKVVQLRFVLSADFRLVEFAYVAPLKVVDVVNASTAVMSFDEIIERIKTQLSLDDIGTYQIYGENAPGQLQIEDVAISVAEMEFGLARIKIKDNFTDFYLVPSVTLRGRRASYNISGAEIGGMTEEISTLLVLNLVDGSVIHFKN